MRSKQPFPLWSMIIRAEGHCREKYQFELGYVLLVKHCILCHCQLLLQNEKESLVAELAAAQQKLAHSEAAAADTAHLSERQRAQLQAQLEEARQAVSAAQVGADAAQQRATDAAAELDSIQRQLAEAQEQLAAVEAARAAAHDEADAVQPAVAPALTPMAKLRSQLGGVHDCLAQLHAEHCAGRLHAANPELDQVRGPASQGGAGVAHSPVSYACQALSCFAA